MCVDLSLGFLFYSIDQYFCLCASTAFEAILGYWYLKGDMTRLDEMAGKAFRAILTAMNEEREGN